MFENFRKNTANTLKDLPKEDASRHLEELKKAPPAEGGTLNTYNKAKEEHLQQAEIKQEVWAEKLEQQKQEALKKEEVERKILEITALITELKQLGINTDAVEKELNALLKTQPENTIEIAGKKIEMGPYLGEFNWDNMNKELEKLNKTLKSGEKEWRILTKEEYQELEKLGRAIWNEKGLLDDEKRAKFNEFITKLGFAPGRCYWSSEEYEFDRDLACNWNPNNGHVNFSYKDLKLSVQCVR
jgi:hypothetical protein